MRNQLHVVLELIFNQRLLMLYTLKSLRKPLLYSDKLLVIELNNAYY